MSANEFADGILENFGKKASSPSVFMKELLYVALSQITFRRQMFTKHVYVTKPFYNSLVEVVTSKCGLENVLKFCNALRSIMQAMDAEYLRTMLLSLHESGSSAAALETYSVTFSYKSPNVLSQIPEQRTNLDLMIELVTANREDRVVHLLKQMESLSTHNTRNPAKEYYIAIRAFFYKNTPQNYSLPCFEPFPPSMREMSQPPEAKKLRLEEDEASGHALLPPMDTSPQPIEPILAGESDPLFNFDSQQQVNQTAGTAVVASADNISQESENGTEPHHVHCPCGDHDDDGLMICCAYCQTWQHAVCFRVISQDFAPETHVCVDCAKKYNDRCTDEELVNEVHTSDSVEMICALRRALAFCAYGERITQKGLQACLGADAQKARKIVEKLKELNVIEIRKGRYSVVEDTLTKVLILHFGEASVQALLGANAN